MSVYFIAKLRISNLCGVASLAAASIILLAADTAFASQGPGIAPGNASPITQLAMAIVVYGASAVIVAAGLIGAALHR